MSYKAINLQEKFGLFEEHWAPKVVAEMNDYQFKVVKVQGDFIWHDHKNTDETFIVIEGDLRIDFRDGAVHLGTGEMVIVPRGVEHKALRRERGQIIAHRAAGCAQYRSPGRSTNGGERRLDLSAEIARLTTKCDRDGLLSSEQAVHSCFRRSPLRVGSSDP
jgi:mannose-6-phosphate isomerase-like protein (cupin superfamily)